MRLQIEPSEIFVEVDNVRCRVWNGVAESGEQVFVFVARVAVPDQDRSSIAFIEELIEMPAPRITPGAPEEQR